MRQRCALCLGAVISFVIGCQSSAPPRRAGTPRPIGSSFSVPVWVPEPAITTADLRQRLYLIAADSLMGRETGSQGAFKASAYVASEFRRLHLEPAGDSGTYFQAVPFWVVAMDPQSRLVTSGGSTLQLGIDFLPVSFAVPPRVLEHTPIVYAGSVADTA